tara:strand:+ start:122 stop:337 length:216 start_codon:yes stop_codon:yes gene_type:complete
LLRYPTVFIAILVLCLKKKDSKKFTAKDFPITNKKYLTLCHQFFGGWDNQHASKYNEKVEKLLKNDKIELT